MLRIIYISINQTNHNNDILNNMTASLDESEIKKFDCTNVKGTDVINAIQNNKELCIIVKYPCDASVCMAFNRGINDNSWDKNGTYKNSILPEITALIDSYSTLHVSNSADKENYINPSANFESKLLKNKNEVIIGITFLHIR